MRRIRNQAPRRGRMTDRVHTLTLLERLRRHEMAAEAGELATLRAQVATWENTRATLQERLNTEARIISIESAPYVGAFIRGIRNEEAQIDRDMAKVAPRVQELEIALAEQFRALATIRLALGEARNVLREAQAQREIKDTEEQALLRWAGTRSRRAPSGLRGTTSR